MADLINAQIDWLGDGTPYSSMFGDIYFSSQGGPAESRHVFLEANRLSERWSESVEESYQRPFLLVELGFGTGLNFLLSWALFERVAAPGRRLHYLAFEQYPLTRDDLARALESWPELADHAEQLIHLYVDHTSGLHRYRLSDAVTLDLYFGDAQNGLTELLPPADPQVDCWFLDGFAPARNPSLWSEPLFQRMGAISRAGATASTYSVAGQVRRGLQAAGFAVEKQPGFGHKRHMLLAIKPAVGGAPAVADPPGRPAWFVHRVHHRGPRTVTVIGAGLAGCSTASSLALRGWQVTLIEEAADIAAGASGNPRALLQPRLAADDNAQSRFYLHGLLFASRQFSQLQQRHDIGWQNCGVLRLATAEARQGLATLWSDSHRYYDQRVVRRVSRSEASALAGLSLAGDALWLPAGGCLDPSRLCRAYLETMPAPQLQLITGQRVTNLTQHQGGWRVHGPAGCLAESSVVVLANSYRANTLDPTGFLPLRPVGGQLTLATPSPASGRLACAVVAERYICPASDALQCVGASYTPGSTAITSNAAADQENLDGVAAALVDTALPEACGSRVSVRCNAADYFPVVGAVPEWQAFNRVYAQLARDAGARVTAPAPYLPGLYVNLAHGSYGLASCPLAAEMIAGLVEREPLPVTSGIADSLNPARFLIRDLKKQRVAGVVSRD